MDTQGTRNFYQNQQTGGNLKIQDWIEKLKSCPEGTDELIFRITRGCDRCAWYLPDENGNYECAEARLESYCRRDHEHWLGQEFI